MPESDVGAGEPDGGHSPRRTRGGRGAGPFARMAAAVNAWTKRRNSSGAIVSELTTWDLKRARISDRAGVAARWRFALQEPGGQLTLFLAPDERRWEWVAGETLDDGGVATSWSDLPEDVRQLARDALASASHLT
jgi:hypothetical protein